MGCDIHIMAQKRENGKWVTLDFRPFDWRSYGMFGFLADVRNVSCVPPVSEPRGYPPDFDGSPGGDHSESWLSVAELVAFDYSQTFEDRRCRRQESQGFWNGAADAGEGNGKQTTFKDFLDGDFFIDLIKLVHLGAERIVFNFDN
jgi:hypothetical protein